MRTLFNFLVPGSFLVSGALFIFNSPYASLLTQNNIDLTALILAAICALLAWRFDRFRVFYTLQLLIFADYATRYLAQSKFTSIHLFVSAALLLNLSIVAVFKERGMRSSWGLMIGSLPALQAMIITILFQQERFNLNGLFSGRILNLPSPLSTLPESILLLAVVAITLQLIRFLRYPNPLEGALFWTVIAVSGTLYRPETLQTSLLYTISILTLFISFIEMSYTLAYRDELTGVPGRRALMEAFKKLGNRYSIALVAIDFFKKFNDKYGHDIGDQVLKMVAARLAKCGAGGRAFRYGGEEFCVVFPGKNSEDCLDALEDLRTSIGDHPFTIRKITRPLKKPKKSSAGKRKQNTVKVTVSIGVAEKTSLYNQPEIVMKRADQALYRAKESGRNRVSS